MKIIIYIAMLVICIAALISVVLHLRFMYPYIAAFMPILFILYFVSFLRSSGRKNSDTEKDSIENNS